MNKHMHRLVFDRRRGMRVAVAETARSAGKAPIGAMPVMAALGAACLLFTMSGPASAQSRSLSGILPRSGAILSARGLAGGSPVPNLPVASRSVLPVDPSDPKYAAYLAAQAHAGQDIGSAVISQDGTQMLVKQNDQKVKINWETFDIGKGYSVHFEQPAKGVAWNYVWDANPSVIQGHLTATGEVILENHNGVIFSPTARIETARFVATALHLTQDAFDKGLRAQTQGAPVFTDDDLSSLNGFISVERGAEVKALAGGDVIMVAPKVYNEGRIETTDGQAVLAAGQHVYLYESQDPAQRGLLVSVDAYTAGPDGTAASLPAGTNVVEQAVAQEYKTVNGETVGDSTPDSTPGLEKKINAIVSERGSINLVGMVVRQNGVLNATTAVKGRNGGIYLMAVKDSITTGSDPTSSTSGNNPAQPNNLGSVELGVGSQTTVTPALEYVSVKDPTTQQTQVVEATQTSTDPFYRSRIDVVGADVRVDSGASVAAPSGNVSLLAAQNYQSSVLNNSQNTDTGDDGSRLVVDSGASISVAGLRNVVLPMSANQQSGRLFSIELADSPVQRNGVLYRSFVTFDARQPISVANVNGFYNLTTYNARQLSTRGGNLRIESQGSTVISDGAKLDISGGSVLYQAGAVTSSLLRRGDQLVRLEDAQPGVHYDELITPSLSNGGLVNTPSYVQGYDAGAARIDGHKVYMGADLKADVVVGPYQRAGKLTGTYSGIDPVTGTTDPSIDSSFLDPSQAGTPSEEAGFPSVLATQPWTYASLRPRGGVLIVGKGSGDTPKSAQMLDSITLASTGAASPGPAPDLSSAQADQFFADLPTATVLNASNLQAAGLGGLVLSANTIHYDGNLSLTASGSLNLYGANVDFKGIFQSPGGSVTLKAYRVGDGTGDLAMEAGSRIDVSGTRLDETGGNAGDQAIALKGGSVDIQAGHTLDTAQGSAIDVSAGVWRPAAGTVQEGQAGSIALTANATGSTDKPVNVSNGGDLLLGATLSGYDFGKGGTLTLDGIASPLTIGNMPAATGLTLAPDFFSRNGFGTFNVSAYSDINILPCAQLTPTLMNWVYAAPRGHVGGDALTQLQTLEAGLRAPVSLNLNANFGTGLANLTVGKGAVLNAGLGGTIKFRASGFMDILGSLIAHGGTVDLGLSGAWGSTASDPASALSDASTDQLGYLPDQILRLAGDSVIDVSGAAKTTRVAGRTIGSVLGGGQLLLDVSSDQGPVRGRVVVEEGSTIDVSGAAADLNLDGSTRLTHVSAGAGTVQIGSTEGFALMGNLRAFRPDASVSGGQFIAALTQGGFNSYTNGATPYPNADRIINVLDAVGDVQAAAAGTASYGQGFVSAQSLLGSGFDRIALKADHAVALGAGVDLKQTAAQTAGAGLLRSVQLDSPSIQSLDDQSHTIQAQYVALGNKDVAPLKGQSYVAPTAKGSTTASDNSLTVNAGLIESYGHSAFVGFDNVKLNATLDAKGGATRTDGEVRFIGTGYASAGADAHLTGSLDFAGTLDITAGQSYATTLSDFTVQGEGSGSVLNVFGPGADHAGSTSRPPLSALAQLHLDAPTVNIDGTLRQPFGAITVGTATAPVAATFGPHSLLSVSGDGTAVPVGNTVDQVQWVYATDGSNNAANFSTDNAVQSLDSLPVTKGIAVNGNGSLTIDPAAKVQAQAGGDLLAWEFVTGVGGSSDTLTRKNVFAVLPGYSYSFAPYDTEIQASTAADGTTLAAGSQVTVTTPNGILAPGTYTLLPARYAILPGAVLVSAQTKGSTQTLSKPVQQDDGSAYVSGSLGAVGTAINGGNDPRVVLALEPEATYRAKSTLLSTSINQLLTAQAQRYNTAVGVLPGDAGRVSLASTNPFDWAAQYNLGGAGGFAGGEFDLSIPKIALVSQGQAAPDGYAAVSAQSLNATGAQSILLGGVRSGAGNQTVVTTTADDVQIGSGSGAATTLGVNELIAVAKDHVNVASGASVISNAADASISPKQITVQGDGAALVVSDNANLDLRRDLSAATGSTGAAQISVGAGTQLKGATVQIDASKAVNLDAAARIEAQTFGLGAPKLAMGGAGDDPSAVVVQGDLLNRLVQSTQLQLRGYQGIDWVGSVNFNAPAADGTPRLQSVVLDTPQMRGLGGAGDVVTIAAKSVTLRNTSGTTVTAGSGQSKLIMQAQPPVQDGSTGGLTLGEGAQHLAFANTSLQSTGDIVLSGQGQVSTQGDATLSAARVTADNTANYTVTSGGVLTVTQPTGAHTLGEHVGAGAVVSLSGQRVVQDGVIDLPSGQVTLNGSGQSGHTDTVVFTARSTTGAAGWVAAATSSVAHTDGGVVAPGGSITASASQGNVEVYGTLDVSAPTPVSNTDTGAAAGTIALSATGSGDAAVVLGSSAKILGQSGAGSDAGLNGSLKIDAQHLAKGGADAGAAMAQANLDRVAQLASAGRFNNDIEVRVRQGDQSLSQTLQATRVILAADQGSLTLTSGGAIDAGAPAGGVVQVSTGKDLVMQDGFTIDAHSSRAGANGGDVLLASTAGRVSLQGGIIDTHGDDAQDGRVVVRATRNDAASSDANRVQVDPIKAKVTAGEFDVEAVRRYTATDLVDNGAAATHVVIDTNVQNQLWNDSNNFLSHSAGILSALGSPAGAQLRSGVEIDSTGDITVANDWTLSAKGGSTLATPTMLSLRAAGNLSVNGTLSDGFATASRAALTAAAPTAIVGAGASMRLAAGADLSAANVLQTQTNAASGAGNLSVAAAKMVRTTSGSIEMAAAGDVQLQTDVAAHPTSPTQAVVYVAGAPSGALADGSTFNASAYRWAQYTDHGGRVEVNAGHDIVAPAPSQLFNNWFYHGGANSAQAVTWFSALDSFKQGLGSFGGGNVRVTAGGDIRNLGVVAPTSARNLTLADGSLSLSTQNGGDILVQAGGNIAGGDYFLGRGQGRIQAAAAITTGDSISPSLSAVGPVLGLMDGHWTLQANDDLTSSFVYNPTMLSSSSTRMPVSLTGGYFTYGVDSGVSMSSVRGTLDLDTSAIRSDTSSYLAQILKAFCPSVEQDNIASSTNLLRLNLNAAAIAPPVLKLAALSGNATVNIGASKGLWTFPSAQASLDLYAGNQLTLTSPSATGVYMGMLDGDPGAWPSVDQPITFSGKSLLNDPASGLPSDLYRPGATNISLGTVHGSGSVTQWYAGGNLTDSNVTLRIPQAANIVAGGDISGLIYTGQNNAETDVTQIAAGGSIKPNGVQGFLATLYGPGAFNVLAGRQLDLSQAGKITAVGRGGSNEPVISTVNPALPDESAHVNVAAGLSQTLNVDPFLATFMQASTLSPTDDLHGLTPSSTDAKAQAVYEAALQSNDQRKALAALLDAQAAAARAELKSYVQSTLDLSDAAFSADPSVAYAQAVAYFKQLTPAHQAEFAYQVMQQAFVSLYLGTGAGAGGIPSYLDAWKAQASAAGVAETDYASTAFQNFEKSVLMNEIKRAGTLASSIADSTNDAENAKRKALRADLWNQVAVITDLAGLGRSFSSVGDINLSGGTVQTTAPGDLTHGGIDLFAPGGQVLVGLSVADPLNAQERGLVTQQGGSIRSYSQGDFLVNAQKVFVVNQGDLIAYSSNGNIDSGRGANTDVTVSVPKAQVQADGTVKFVTVATTGSGLGILGTQDAQYVLGLYAPNGEVRALDAYIVGPTIQVASPVVKGADNLKSGSGQVFVASPAVSVNVNTGTQAQSSEVAQTALANANGSGQKAASSLLTVDLIGLGADPTAAGPGEEPCDEERRRKALCH